MAHKKAAGSSRNGRDSAGQRRGVKIYGGQKVRAGNIGRLERVEIDRPVPNRWLVQRGNKPGFVYHDKRMAAGHAAGQFMGEPVFRFGPSQV